MAAASTVADSDTTVAALATVSAAIFQAAISAAVADGMVVKAGAAAADGTVAGKRAEDGTVAADMAKAADSMAEVEDSTVVVVTVAAARALLFAAYRKSDLTPGSPVLQHIDS